jgi:hypothetical protein
MAQAFIRRPLTAESRVSPCGIFGGQSSNGTNFSPVNFIPSVLYYKEKRKN